MKRFSWFAGLSAFLVLSWSCGAAAKEVRVAFGLSLPPYVIKESNSGAEMEIIRAALVAKGHTLTPSYVPLGRVAETLASETVDAVQRDGGVNLEEKGGHYSDDVITYQNAFIILESNGLEIKSPADLKSRKVLAYQGASKNSIVAPWLVDAVGSDKYNETPDQLTQVKMLFSKRIDVVLSDKNIFTHFSKKAASDDGIVLSPVKHFQPFSMPAYRAVFKDKEIRDDFNSGLKMIRESGEYEEIYNKFTK